MKILFIGDIVGKSGRDALASYLPELRKDHHWDLCIANGENAAGGKGLTESVAHDLLDLGIDIMTMGNHTWDNKEIFSFIDSAPWLIRPCNYPVGTPGQGWIVKEVSGKRVGVINVAGQVFMNPLDCPFTAMDRVLAEMDVCDYYLVDMHAEATSEKLALAYYLDGRVGAVLGTHTHIQTADERVLPNGTVYITDVGMTGALISVLGMEVTPVVERFTTKLPRRFKAASGPGMVNAVWLDLDAQRIIRLQRP
ncbi:MAG: TIGR00282 family metallophosphoesterase [Firmicutes bacterium]|nr:TIGR00282 family metallophosphoesterase [Bacillota bacterium]